MREWRNENQPPSPTDIANLAEVLNCDQWTQALKYTMVYADEFLKTVETSSHVIETFEATSDNGASHVVLGSKTYAKKFMEADCAYMDGTFAVTPNLAGAYQVLTLMLNFQNEVLPVCWAIMSRKTSEAYDVVIDTIMDNLLPNLNLRSVMTDFEPALQNAMRRRFPQIEVHGCYFHHCHALLKERQRSSVITRVKKDHPQLLSEAFRYERDLMNLAFLPPQFIEEAFENLHKSLLEKKELYDIMAPFFAYYRSYWIQQKGPELYSVYQQKDRTNNRLERYHRSLKATMATNPEIYKFLMCLKSIQEKAHQDLQVVEHGLQLHSALGKKYREKERRIDNAWDSLGDLASLSKPSRGKKIESLLKNLRSIHSSERFDEAPPPNHLPSERFDEPTSPNHLPSERFDEPPPSEHLTPAADGTSTISAPLLSPKPRQLPIITSTEALALSKNEIRAMKSGALSSEKNSIVSWSSIQPASASSMEIPKNISRAQFVRVKFTTPLEKLTQGRKFITILSPLGSTNGTAEPVERNSIELASLSFRKNSPNSKAPSTCEQIPNNLQKSRSIMKKKKYDSIKCVQSVSAKENQFKTAIRQDRAEKSLCSSSNRKTAPNIVMRRI